MIFKRAAAKLRAQDWVAITIELAIVIVGVFLGTQVSNWNATRIEQRETQQMLTRLKPELRNLLAVYASARSYYRLTRQYATTAFAGWRGDPKVSDREFVIAAYQASQIYATAANNATWATIFGADRLRTIDDPVIRDNLSFLMYADMSTIDNSAMETPYRVNVRRVIPVEIQDAIRDKCGDQRPPNNPQLFYLPAKCDVEIDPHAAATAAAALRARPELVDDLRWHTAAAASFLNNTVAFEMKTRTLARRIEELD
jgi:hypothetical protein